MPAGRQLRAWLEAALQRLWFDPAPGAARRILLGLLSPLAWLTGRIAGARRERINQRRLDSAGSPPRPFVLVIGNLVAGGAGKTPLTIAISAFLERSGYRVGLICRGGPAGAGRALSVAHEDGAKMPAGQIGDEARLLARATGLPVVIGHRRAAALAELCRLEPALDVVISDDGLQHEALRRDLELVLLDLRGLGNRRLLPAGPLREPADALGSADAIVFNTGWQADAAPPPTPDQVPVFRSSLQVTDVIGLDAYLGRSAHEAIDQRPLTPATLRERLAGQTVAAVAGIASPESFFTLLESFGLTINRYAPGDHADLDDSWLDSLQEPAVMLTEKDAVKCPTNSRGRLYVLRISASPEPALFDWLVSSLPPAQHRPENTGSTNDGPPHS